MCTWNHGRQHRTEKLYRHVHFYVSARVIQYKQKYKTNGFRFGFGCQNGFGLVLNIGAKQQYHLRRRWNDIDMLAKRTASKACTPAADSTESAHQWGYTGMLIEK